MKAEHNISHYKIINQLGKGGMGEVYLAEDTKLDRKVALKLLPAEFTQDPDRVRRFVQEAKAASALNHPNIITIYEIGEVQAEAGSTHYIATEFIEGQTLRSRMAHEKLSLSAALDVAIQTASALAAAHEAGIIHRDIKPENVMVRPDGLVKVLDFGLAKLVERKASIVDTDAPTGMQIKTDPGTVMGTASYMSPEQARGVEVDTRTDIFSLGVMLYEMIAGCAPFGGVNAVEVLSAILKTEPALLKQHAPNSAEAVPAELQRMVSKALRKDRDERYQVIKELLLDLKSLKQELEIEARIKGRQASEIVAPTVSSRADETPEVEAARTTSSAKIILSEIKRHKRGVALALAALLVIVAGAGFGIYKLLDRKSATPTQALKITRLTSTGKATRAAIAPDGKYVVYALDEGGQQSLWVTQVAASSNVQIAPPANVDYVGITFSRDGNFIYYVRTDKENPSGALWQSPVLGGNARKLLVNVSSPITLSPDGKQLAFVRNDPSQKEWALIVANADGAEEKKLATRKYPDWFDTGGPAWSPDGKIIACGQMNYTGGSYRNVIGVRVADGAEQPMTSHRWEAGNDPIRIAWLSDNSGVLATAAQQAGSPPQIWYLAWPGDDARSVTNDLTGYADITLTADSGTLSAVRSDRAVNLWIAPNGEANRARQITSGAEREDGIRGLAWTPDGKIVYRSEAGGHHNIWMLEADGAGNKQLSAPARHHYDPAVSPDGRYIVWSSRRTRSANLWRMEIDGSNPKQLTNGVGEYFPQVSLDGKWVVYCALGNPLWKIPIDGGDPVPLTDKPALIPVISPDGKLIACNYLDEASGQYKIAVIPFEGGSPIKIFDVRGSFTRPHQWTPDGRAIAFIRTTNGVSNIWAQPLAGGELKQLTDFKDQRIFNFAWSRDGKQIALSRGVVNGDVVLISGFK